MARRLALLAKQTHESPWTRASGDESAVKIEGLGEGEKVWIKVGMRQGGELLLFFAEGLTSLLDFGVRDWTKYQVGKISDNGGRQLTCVEVYLGGY